MVPCCTAAVYDAIDAQDTSALGELFDPHIVRHAASEIGIEPAIAAMERAFATNPARHFRVEDVIAEGDKAALRVTVLGTPTTPGVPPPLILKTFRSRTGGWSRYGVLAPRGSRGSTPRISPGKGSQRR